jgi:hypothetical protein
MALETIVFLLSAVLIILAAINAVFLWQFFRTNRKMNEIMESGRVQDFKTLFLRQKDKDKHLAQRLDEAFLKIKNLEEISEITIQKTGIVRFNPFNELGGNQSFVIALLDNQNNGFVISSLFVKEGNRVYAKAIRNGKSDHLLSGEEIEAINRAVNSK